MHKQTPGVLSCARWLMPVAALSMLGCPKQELAPLGPCTVSAVNERVDQTGVDQVDLLFVLDNSGSMASEQERLGKLLPKLVKVLTTGDTKPDEPQVDRLNNPRYFTPVRSLHIGVVTSNMGGIDDPSGTGEAINSCKGLGDDGKLVNSFAIAQQDIIAATDREFEGYTMGEVVLAKDDECTKAPSAKYLTFVAGAEPDADEVATTFRCISRVGVRGCPFEQQLEAMWKALAPGEAPSDAKDKELYEFLNDTKGQGTRANEGFLRDEAILAIMHVSDEEDCSIKQEGKPLFDNKRQSEAEMKYGEKINLRCGLFGEKDELVWPAERYVNGLKALKPDYPDRIIFGAIVGIPQQLPKDSTIADILERNDMQFMEDGDTGIPRPSCIRENPENPARSDKAYPPRRFLQVADAFGANAVLHSICADDYAPALDKLIERIAQQLKGNCLPRQLRPSADGTVVCNVFELIPSSESKCDPKRGHDGNVVERILRENGKNVKRKACLMKQVPVLDGKPKDSAGWYYDNFSDSLKDCPPGEQQRIAFSFGELPSGSGATFECFQPVAKIDTNAKGVDAVNTRCSDGESEDVCGSRSDDEAGYQMICEEESQTCQIKCDVDPECPPGWVCDTALGSGKGKKFCQQPTCQAE